LIGYLKAPIKWVKCKVFTSIRIIKEGDGHEITGIKMVRKSVVPGLRMESGSSKLFVSEAYIKAWESKILLAKMMR
jgi:hypothetical protein